MTDREEWLEKKRHGIGGSEISVLMGVNRYKTPYQLWLEKTNRSPPPEENKYMLAGRLMEPVIEELFQRQVPVKIAPQSAENILYVHPKYPYILGTPDRIYTENEQVGILEFKNTRQIITPEIMPKSWFCQVQWYMALTGYEHAYVAWLVQGVDLYYQKFEFDEILFKHMIQIATEFWSFVEKDIPPPEYHSGDLELRNEHHFRDVTKMITATEETSNLINRLKEIRVQASALKHEEERIVEVLKMIIKYDSGIQDSDGNVLVTWKSKSKEKTRRFFVRN